MTNKILICGERIHFVLDTDDHNATYFPIPAADSTDAGWNPIGDHVNYFTGIFDGNGYSISNMAIRRNLVYVGLFARLLGADAVIRNIGLEDSLGDHTGTLGNIPGIGTLLGRVDEGSVIASYSKNGTVEGGTDGENFIGVLVGHQNQGSTIIASYASGIAIGRVGNENRVGVLVGRQDSFEGVQVAHIIASYASGTAVDGPGDIGRVGVLVADPATSLLTASYADGRADGGNGNDDRVGLLLGEKESGISSIHSYGFGTTAGIDDDDMPNSEGTTYPNGVSTPNGLTAENTGTTDSGAPAWNDAASNTLGAWDFGTASQNPALKYADYDGPDGDTYSCDMFPEGLCNTIIPGQGR